MTVPPPTPNRPLKAPAPVPTVSELREATAGHGRDTTSRADSATLADVSPRCGAIRPVLRCCSTSTARSHRSCAMPPTRPCPSPTRSLLIAISRRYGFVACVSGRQSADARRVVSIGRIAYVGNHGSASCCAPAAARPSSTRRAGGRGPTGSAAFGREQDSRRLRRCRIRLEDKGPIMAFHWRGAPDEEAAKAAVDAVARRGEAAGLRHALGPQGARDAPAGADRQGRRDRADVRRRRHRRLDHARALRGRRPTDLDAFRGLRELATTAGSGRRCCVGVAAPTGRRTARSGRRDLPGIDGVPGDARRPGRGLASGPMRFSDFLKATVFVSAAAPRALLAAVTVAAASHDGDPTVVFVGAGWWVLAALYRRVPRPPPETNQQIARCSPARAGRRRCPRSTPGRTLLNRLWPLLVSDDRGGRLAFVFPQASVIACGFAHRSARSPGAGRRRRSRRSRSATACASTSSDTSPFDADEARAHPGLQEQPARAERQLAGAAARAGLSIQSTSDTIPTSAGARQQRRQEVARPSRP